MPASSVVPISSQAEAPSRPSTPAVEISGVNHSYGDRQALRDVGLIIGRGEIFGLLGPNGGGKTTLFKLLSTLVPLQSGEASILGFNLRGETMELRRRLGVVFQHPSVDGKLTV
ncbi:MAG: ATP-binding cassette domain-containing protein, partial [Ktedonobacteraceae bacterium]